MQETNETKKALITGASRGIGAATLKALVADGFKVHGTATSETGIKAIKEAGGIGHIYKAGDAGDLEKLLIDLPAVSVLVCNAGITKDTLFTRMSDEQIQDVFNTNLIAPFKLAQAYVSPMTKARYGRVIMLSSVVAQIGNPGQTNYTASKAGLEGLVRSLAKEIGSRNITVNAVAPGFIETDMTKTILAGKHRDQLLANIPLRRAGKTEEVAHLISFLASDKASYITGATLSINGGLATG